MTVTNKAKIKGKGDIKAVAENKEQEDSDMEILSVLREDSL